MVFYNLCNLLYDLVFFFFSSFYKFCCYLFMYLLTIKKASVVFHCLYSRLSFIIYFGFFFR